MDNNHPYGPTLAYNPFADQAHRQQLTAMAVQPWHHQPPPPMAGPPSDQSGMYHPMNPTLNHVQYSVSPTFYNHYPPNNPGNQQPVVDQDHALNLTGPPIESSIGPSRVITRRQTRSAQMQATPQPPHRQANPGAISQDENHDRQHQMYLMPRSLSRPQTPDNAVPPGQYSHHGNSSVAIGPSPLSMQSHPTSSPQYPTPSTSSAPYPYSYFPAHSRSGSNSTNSASTNGLSNPRSASPALSVASALTTVSSASNSQTFQNYTTAVAAPKTKQRKQRLFNVDRKEICMFHKENPNMRQEDIAARYGVERSTISKILKQKTKWMNVPEGEEIRIAKHRPSKFPEIEMELRRWLLDTVDDKLMLTDSVIRSKAKEVAKRMEIPDEKFKASSGWVENFKQRHGIKRGIYHGVGKNTLRARALGYGPGYIEATQEPDDAPPQPMLADFILKHNLYDLNRAITFPNGLNYQILNPEPESEDEDQDEIIEVDNPNPQAGPSTGASHRHSPGHGEPSGSQRSPLRVDSPSQDILSSGADTSISSMSTASSSDAPPTPTSAHEPAGGGLPGECPAADNPVAAVPYETVYQTSVKIAPVVGPGIPTMAETEAAIDTVLMFVDAQHDGLLTDDEHSILMRVKHALFQLASGVPYDRDLHE